MKYQVVYETKAIKSLSKIDKDQQAMILGWVKKNLVNTTNPRKFGKALKGNLKEYWRYRIGDYRLIVDISDNQVKIIIININHRSKIYIED